MTHLAYIIAAHHQPKQLGRMIRALYHRDDYFFIHINAKSNLHLFKQSVEKADNIIFLSQRKKVYWGGSSLLRVILHLMQTVRQYSVQDSVNFSYCIYLSGNDYPIKPLTAIRQKLSVADKEWIRVDGNLVPQTNAFLDDGSYEHIAYRYFFDNPLFNPRSSLPHKLRLRLQSVHQFLTMRVMGSRSYIRDFVPYKGSSWWALTLDCINYLLDFIKQNQNILRFHNQVLVPEEILFHSILKQSPFAEKILMDCTISPCTNVVENGSHFIDWRPENYRYECHLVLDMTYREELLASDCLFARKFDEHLSFDLLDLIDREILAKP
ncbi:MULTISPECIES: beta-1,6-N-acetylglucosaminyltransferase [Spirulina sp. CCY15215]|uniref:beta-1,6-N-acetylglucosaminyltransferase n=1 Tax=Spirulina sp. CCY15215 TaxID=2767591 RepID=UPI0019515067|nr:beta-1,6-N-acetylglucosaminyltransferase [Spirulina major]